MSRYLGIDFGEKRVGVAISDPTCTISRSLTTIEYSSQQKLLQELKKITQEFRVQKVILGLPVTMKGSDSRKTQEVRQFSEKLKLVLNLPIELIDERLTTSQAHFVMRQLGKKPSRNKKMVDRIAAQGILQTYLDREKTR